jgi:hypothetical protein
LEEREVNPRVFWNPIVTNGKYVIVVVEIQNKGTSEEFITSNSFKLTDQDGREYYLTPLIPSTSYNDFTFYDNNNQPVRVHDHIAQNLPLTTAIKPGIPTTFGLIFEVAKDTDSINLVFMTS